MDFAPSTTVTPVFRVPSACVTGMVPVFLMQLAGAAAAEEMGVKVVRAEEGESCCLRPTWRSGPTTRASFVETARVAVGDGTKVDSLVTRATSTVTSQSR